MTEWKEINLNSNDFAKKQSVKNVLELCQCVCSREESNALKDGCNGDRGKLLTTCEQAEKKLSRRCGSLREWMILKQNSNRTKL